MTNKKEAGTEVQKQETGTEVQKQETGQVTQVKSSRGFEEKIDNADLLIPRAKKIEAMSPETEEGVKPGTIINSVTKEELPEHFVPVFFFKSWIRFNPRVKDKPGYNADFGPGDIIYRTNDPLDPRLKTDGVWRGDTPPLATAFLNFFSIFEGVEVPIIVSFCNTNYKAGKTLLSLARFSGGDMFSKKYSLTTKQDQNDQGKFYILRVKLAGKPTDEESKLAERYYNDFRGKDLHVHEEQEESQEVPF